MTAIVTAFRQTSWLDARRALAWVRILAAFTAASVAYLLVSTCGGLGPDAWGRPLGTDFASFWSAARLALAGAPGGPWDPALHAASQLAQFGAEAGFVPAYYAFFYPPPFLLICLPLGLLPYSAALAVWVLSTTAAFLLVMRALLPPGWPAALIALAFPAVTLNAAHGQNGALCAALMGAAALLLDRRPLLAGACLGALFFKPQLALLIVPALIAARRWRALAGVTASAGAMVLLSWLVLGEAAWLGFFRDTTLATETLEAGLVGFAKMTSPFAGLRLLNANLGSAWAGQAIVSLGALALVLAVTHRRPGAQAEIATIAAAACLATPFLLDYDLMLLAIPLAVSVARAARHGFLPWERLTLAAAYVLPLLAPVLAVQAGLPIAPPMITILLIVVVRRALQRASQTEQLRAMLGQAA